VDALLAFAVLLVPVPVPALLWYALPLLAVALPLLLLVLLLLAACPCVPKLPPPALFALPWLFKSTCTYTPPALEAGFEWMRALRRIQGCKP
jgi:hypothetical protein